MFTLDIVHRYANCSVRMKLDHCQKLVAPVCDDIERHSIH